MIKRFSLMAAVLAGTLCAEDVYVAGFAAKKLYRVGPGGIVTSIPMPAHPFDMVLTADGAFLYVSHPTSGTISVVRTADDRIVASLPAPSPAKLAIGNNDRRLYVATNSVAGPHVWAIDISPAAGGRRNAGLASLDLSSHGANSAYTVAARGDSLAVGTQTGHVLLFDTSHAAPRLIEARQTGARVMHVLFSPLGTKLYALLATPAGGGNLHVFRIDGLEPKIILSAGRSELKSGAVLDTAHLYVADVRGVLHVIDIGTDTVEASMPLGRQAGGITTAGGRLFVSDPAANAIRTIIPAGHYAPGKVERTVILDKHAAPVGLAARRR